jgi:predicted LPLAT superfamily acyltransferase
MSTSQALTTERKGAGILPLVLSVFGLRLCYALAPLVVLFYFATGRQARRAIIAFHRRLQPEATEFQLWRNAFTNFVRFSHTLIDRLAMASGCQRFDSGVQTVGAIRAVPPGSFLIGAHLGDWFCASSRLADEIQGTLAIVMNGTIGARYQQILSRHGVPPFTVIDSSNEGLDFLLQIKQALDAGSIVCVLGDRIQSNQRTVRVPFFGAPAPVSTAIFELAARFRRPIYSVFAPKSAPRPEAPYHVYCDRIWDGSESTTAEGMAQRYLALLEQQARRAPDQWFNFFDFWA